MHGSALPHLVPKSILIFLLEDILFPGNVNSAVDMKSVKQVLKSVQKYAKSHSDFQWYGVSGLKVEVCEKKLKEFGLETYFPEGKVFAVNDAFVQKLAELDRELYEKKCAADPECKDEYARQVQLQALMEKKKIPVEAMLLVGHDYWFDGFYTRRFSKIDVAFVESALSNKGHLATERVDGLWHIAFAWKDLLALIEGKVPACEYKHLDEFVVTSISKELFGGQGFSLQKKVIDLRKLKEAHADHSELPSPPKPSKK